MEESVFQRMSGHDAAHWWFVARRRILRDQIATLGLPADARILEAGCGPAGNLAMLSEFGSVEAFEPNDTARRIAEERTGLSVRAGTLPDDALFPPESFDLVAAFDVVEHIQDDDGAVRSLARTLKPGGHFIMTVPAYAWLWSAHGRRHHHKRRYTSAAVRDLLERAGLTIDKCSYYNTLLMPAVVLRRVMAGSREASSSPTTPCRHPS